MKKILSIILTAVILIGSFSIIGIAKSAPKIPDKVTGVTATAGYNTVKLRWKKSANATSYRIYRYSEAKQRYVRVTETKSTTYYVKGLSVHKTYKFYVKAVNSTKSKTLVGKRSDIVTAKTKYTPSTVKNLKASTVKSSSVTLTWDKSPNVTQYRVYRYNSKTNKYEQVGKTTSNKYTVKGLKANKEYRFKVRVYLKVKEKSYLSEAAMIKVKTKKTTNKVVANPIKNNPDYTDFYSGCKGYWVALDNMRDMYDGTKSFDFVCFEDEKIIMGTYPGEGIVANIIGFEKKSDYEYELVLYYPGSYDYDEYIKAETKTTKITFTNRTLFFDFEPNTEFWYVADSFEATVSAINNNY